jgi:serine/threonine protein kinase
MQRLRIEPGSWKELNRLLDTALDLPPERRAEWLESLDCNDQQLKVRLQAILSHTATVETNGFLESPPKLQVDDATLRATRTLGEQVGSIVGPYRLVREIGMGGMGAVWLAERIDGLIPRPVALKLPHGVWRRAGFSERVTRERQILAALNHPNIARLYDAGITSGGQPYLALEYIPGRRIDAYCDECQLDVRARLLLFLQIAKAVAYAHSKLVVHRDLKPANILVTEDGQTHLLDFGIAKLLGQEQLEAGQLTEMPGLALTPEYASPEQIAGEPISTASDVYSLGVVLFELLTRSRPYKLARDSRGALEDAILQADPPLPSDVVADAGVRRQLRGDLDTILLKALKKRTSERYATVNALAEDIERYLANQPVLARPDTLRYRYAKFLRRNKLAVGAAAAVVLALLIGAAGSFWQARVALAEQRRAEEVKDFLASMLQDADPYRGQGNAPSVTELLRQARARIDSLGAPPELRIELLTLIGSSLLNLEDFDSAEQAVREALDQSAATLGPDHEQTLRARILMIGVHRFRGRTDEMRRELDAVERIFEGRRDVAASDRIALLESRAHLSIDDGDSKQAVTSAKQAFDLAMSSFGERDARTAAAATLLAESYEYSDVSTEFALQAADRAFQLTTAIYGADSKHPRVIIVRDVYGRALCRDDKVQEGLEQLERAMQDATEIFGPTSSTVAIMAGNAARYHRVVGDIKTALANLDRAIDIHRQQVQRESFTYLGPLTARGIALIAARRGDDALRDLTESSQGLHKLFGQNHEETLIAEFHRALALAYVGRADESQAAFEPVLQQYRTTYSDPVYIPSRALGAAGAALRLGGDFAAARTVLEEALKSQPEGRSRIPLLIELGLTQLELDQPARAASLLEEARGLQSMGPQRPTPARTDVLVGLGRVRMALGKPQEALALLQQADVFWQDFDADNRWAGEAAFWLSRCQAALGREREGAATLARAAQILSQSPLASDAKLLKTARRT